jgi:hypothetical protein
MKIAVGVLAFRAPAVLMHTVRHWPRDWQVFVHVDAKADLTQFEAIREIPNVTILPNRFNALWGGFNVVLAELALMQAAMLFDPEVFLLHSDDSVPLMTPTAMIQTLQDSERWIGMVPTNWDVVLDRYEACVCYDIPAANPQQSGGHRFQASDATNLADLAAFLPEGKKKIERLYHRSQWKAVFGPDIPYVLHQHYTEHEQRNSFRFSIIPDEMYIPTILGNKDGGSGLPDRYMWADFSKDPKPYVYRDIAEISDAIEHNYMFVRKIHDPELARSLLQKIMRN